VTLTDTRRAELVATTGVTLDGRPAKIIGAGLQYPLVVDDDKRIEFCWETVERIVTQHAGAFFTGMTKWRYEYAGAHGLPLTRDKAIEQLAARHGDVTVTVYPGAMSTRVRCGNLGPAEPNAAGHGYMPALRAERWGRLLIEAAAVATEANRQRS